MNIISIILNVIFVAAFLCFSPLLKADLVAEYQFEDEQYDGTAGEVKDSSGNGHDGQVNNNSVMESSDPALTGDPGTCSYVSQDDGKIIVSGLPVDTSAGAKTTVTFWMKWDGTDNVMPMGWNFHDIWMISNLIGFNTWSNDLRGISSSGMADTWVHIAAEFTNGNAYQNKLFVNGVEQSLGQYGNYPNHSSAYVNSELRIGGVANSVSYDFHGLIDEFRVYDGVLTESEIQTIMDERHPCEDDSVHHYEIVHDAQGLTCDDEQVLIRACKNADCSELSDEAIQVDLTADGSVKTTLSFTGSQRVNFSHTTAETITLSLADPTIEASDPLVCTDSGGNSCDMTFTDAGFRFLYGSASSIANQTAGIDFADTVAIQAVENNDGVCQGMFTGTKTIALSQENVTPSGTSGLSFSVGGVSIPKYPTTSNVNLTFDADSKATLSSSLYNDAGFIRLHASISESGVSVVGSSNSFWVSPARIEVSTSNGTTEVNGNSASSSITHPAGENFQLQLSAVNDGGTVTQNYSPGQIQFQLARTGPLLTGSVDGQLYYASGQSITSDTAPSYTNASVSNFVNGVSTYSSAYYTEVGLLQLAVQDSDYGNQGIAVNSNAINIGRFTPYNFVQTIADNGVLQASCDTRSAFHAYSGQLNGVDGAIGYLQAPILQITAYNKQGAVTQNYFQDSDGSSNDFMKLTASDISITSPTTDHAALGLNGAQLPITASMNTGTLSQNDLTQLPSSIALPNGVLHYQFSSNDNFVYVRSSNTEVAPFNTNLQLAVSGIFDGDNIVVSSTQNAMPTGIELRYGRWVVENSFGPETQSFPLIKNLEHFDGTQYIVSSDNSCVSYDPSNVLLSNISLDPSLTGIVGSSGIFDNGTSSSLSFSPSGDGNQGQVGFVYDAPDWLKYDWDGNGVHDENPSGIATFGIYRGDDRLFHWREDF
ncbi:MAG: LamG domain-containing protein [Pseudomonadota bacterium]